MSYPIFTKLFARKNQNESVARNQNEEKTNMPPDKTARIRYRIVPMVQCISIVVEDASKQTIPTIRKPIPIVLIRIVIIWNNG